MARPESLRGGQRGPHRFTYTWADLMAMTGLSHRQLKHRQKVGDFDPASLRSVFAFVRRRQGRSRLGELMDDLDEVLENVR